MPVRMPVAAGAFYPLQASACRKQIEAYLNQAKPPVIDKPILSGLVPHAGWVYSGSTAAWVYAALARAQIETVVLLGAVHHWGVNHPCVYPAGSWRTPLGDALVDDELGAAVVAAANGLVRSDAGAHTEEHSIEVQVPFVQVAAPQAHILPIAVPLEPEALDLGKYIGQAVKQTQRRVVAIASSDLTHYGPRYGFAPAGLGVHGLEWAKHNDSELLELAAKLQAEELLHTAERQRSACGGGAIAAAITYALALGAQRGKLLQYTTSYDVLPAGKPSDLVGYGAMVFV
ncbi:MAG: AmmeMemoRadiSam system protein B [Chloroflexi bacterium]|nr:AmmeMemoRadiSam system protein B [Chloroflexota bacterium]